MMRNRLGAKGRRKGKEGGKHGVKEKEDEADDEGDYSASKDVPRVGDLGWLFASPD